MNKVFVWALQWANPYTEPPDGRPRILAQIATTSRTCPPELVAMKRPGDGYSTVFRYLPRPARERSPEQKAVDRQRRLRRRMESRYPLFAEQFTQEKMAAVPRYYLAGESDGDEARMQVRADEAAYYERMTAAMGQLFVYQE